MSGETGSNVSGWTVDTLKALFQTQLDDMRRLLDERYVTQGRSADASLAAIREAVGKAEAATEKRFESVNEFRAQLADQARTFVPRQEYETANSSLTDKVETGMRRNSERIAELELRVTSRLDRAAGTDAGVRTSLDDARWKETFDQFASATKTESNHSVYALIVSAISILVAVATVLVVVIHK